MFNKILLVGLLGAFLGVFRVDYVSYKDFQERLITQYKINNAVIESFIAKHNISIQKIDDSANEIQKYIRLLENISLSMYNSKKPELALKFKEVLLKKEQVLDYDRDIVILTNNSIFLFYLSFLSDEEKMELFFPLNGEFYIGD